MEEHDDYPNSGHRKLDTPTTIGGWLALLLFIAVVVGGGIALS